MITLTMKEARTLLRGRRAFWFLMLTLLLVGGAFCVTFIDARDRIEYLGRAFLARQMFIILSLVQLCTLGLVTPLMTATAFSAEREHKTLDLLHCAAVPRLALVAGKWLAALIYQAAIVLCLLPILALVFQLGGVGLDEYLFAAVLIGLTIAAYGMLGVAVSARARRSFTAMTITLGTVLFLNLALPFVLILASEVFRLMPIPYCNHIGSTFCPLFLFILYIDSGQRSASLSATLTNSTFISHLIFQGLLFLGSLSWAWWSLKRGETMKPVIVKKIIDDPEVLARRRKRFPYYLVDPLARTQNIDDRQDPLLVKEQRVGGAGRLQATVRLGYAGLLLSIALIGMVFSTSNQDAMETISMLAWGGLSFTALFAPLLAAAVISREREEGTLDLLLVTPLAAGRIVRAKFRSVLRGLAILCLSATAIPLAVQFLANDTFGQNAAALLKALPLAAAFLLLYGAVGVCSSAFCRRTSTAIAVATVATVLMYFSPVLLSTLAGTVHQTYGFNYDSFLNGNPVRYVLAFVCPLLSPIYSFEKAFSRSDWKHESYDEDVAVIAIRAVVIAALAMALLAIATRRLAWRGDGK